jgi:hypothetical protein
MRGRRWIMNIPIIMAKRDISIIMAHEGVERDRHIILTHEAVE